jgi:cupin superfamily protein
MHDAAGGSALERCIACGAGVFAAEYWGRAPLLTRAAQLGGGFGDLLDADAVDELVSARGLRTPFARMAKDGEVLATARFTRGGGAGATINDQLADDKVLALVADGATLVLQGLHRTWPPLVRFATALSDELGHPVQVNAYVTPPQNRGFAPHYDVHDVFVMQVAGHKHWTIHEPVVRDPLADDPWENHRADVTSRATQTPLIDTVLAPGDALYLPRGTIHSATALGETSIHLTVGIHPLTRHHLLRHLLDEAQHRTDLRAALPMGTDLADPAVLAPHLAATADALRAALDDIDTASVARRVGTSLQRSTRGEPIGPLAQLAAADALDETSTLRLRAGLRPSVRFDGDDLVISTLDRDLRLPAAMHDAVKTLLAGGTFVVRELPGLDVHGQVDLARRLLREGVLVPA